MAESDKLYRFLKTVALGPAVEVAFHPWVEGLENIPVDGPAIIASNHLSFSDSILLPIAVPRKITFLAKAEYFNAPGIKGKAMAAFFSGTGQVPVDRTGGNAGTAAIATGVRLLREGHNRRGDKGEDEEDVIEDTSELGGDSEDVDDVVDEGGCGRGAA